MQLARSALPVVSVLARGLATASAVPFTLMARNWMERIEKGVKKGMPDVEVHRRVGQGELKISPPADKCPGAFIVTADDKTEELVFDSPTSGTFRYRWSDVNGRFENVHDHHCVLEALARELQDLRLTGYPEW